MVVVPRAQLSFLLSLCLVSLFLQSLVSAQGETARVVSHRPCGAGPYGLGQGPGRRRLRARVLTSWTCHPLGLCAQPLPSSALPWPQPPAPSLPGSAGKGSRQGCPSPSRTSPCAHTLPHPTCPPWLAPRPVPRLWGGGGVPQGLGWGLSWELLPSSGDSASTSQTYWGSLADGCREWPRLGWLGCRIRS